MDPHRSSSQKVSLGRVTAVSIVEGTVSCSWNNDGEKSTKILWLQTNMSPTPPLPSPANPSFSDRNCDKVFANADLNL